jgi:hypothetical protein
MVVGNIVYDVLRNNGVEIRQSSRIAGIAAAFGALASMGWWCCRVGLVEEAGAGMGLMVSVWWNLLLDVARDSFWFGMTFAVIFG